MRHTLLALLLLGAAGLPAGAAADDRPTCVEVQPGLLRCSEITVEGRQPRSFYVIPRSRVPWEPPPLRRDARGAIRASVRRAPPF